jgi:carboxypeptidase D
MSDVVAATYIRQHKRALAVPQAIMDAFDEADQQCGFKQVLNQLTYPPTGPITIPGNPEGENFKRSKRQATATADPRCNTNVTSPAALNQSMYGPCNYGCATFTSAVDYFIATKPWYASRGKLGASPSSSQFELSSEIVPADPPVTHSFSVYNIMWNCNNTPSDTNIVDYLNLPRVRTAIHAANKTWQNCNRTILDTLSQEFVMPPAYRILPDLLDRGLRVHLYSGDQDMLLSHVGAELVIQNMTWSALSFLFLESFSIWVWHI